jgi:predicted Fe-Mo cluster-binding NifX family protein
MKVAIPSLNGRVSPVFDTARELIVVEVEGGEERSRRIVSLAQDPFLTKRVKKLRTLKIDVLICGGISHVLADGVSAGKTKVISWVAGPVEEVLRAYLGDRLSDAEWRMPGCHDQRQMGAAWPPAIPSS